MQNTFKIATLNINGIASSTRVRRFEDFITRQGIDFALLQEVTHANLNFSKYTAYINEGTDKRGTAILVREGLTLTDIRCRPLGRGIAGTYDDINIINTYAPSGAEMRIERETFYNTDMTVLLPATHSDIILVGDFNCILNGVDSTGQRTHSRALAKLIQGFCLRCVGNVENQTNLHVLYLNQRIPARQNIPNRKPKEM
jgi:exonuclease III